MKGDLNRFLARTDASAERKDWRCAEYWIIRIAGISYNISDLLRKVKTTCQFICKTTVLPDGEKC